MDIPREITLQYGGTDTALLCQRLLSLGVLLPGDWQGELDTSLAAGLSRLVEERTYENGHLRLALSVTNNMEQVKQAYGGGDIFHYAGERYAPLAGLALTLPGIESVHIVSVGRRILEMEEYQEGLGFGCLAILQNAVGKLVGGMTIGIARNLVMDLNDMMDDGHMEEGEDDEDEEGHDNRPGESFWGGSGFSLKHFDAAVPEASWNTIPTNEHIARYVAPHTAPHIVAALDIHLPRWFCKTLAAIHELTKLLLEEREATQDRCTLQTEIFGYPAMPFLIGWSEDDWVGAMFDDYHNMHNEEDMLSMVVWAGTWQHVGQMENEAEQMERLRATMHRFDRVVRMLSLCHRIADLLHTDKEDVQERIRVRV